MTTAHIHEATVRAACAQVGLDRVSLSSLHHHATAVYLVQPAGIVARVHNARHERSPRTAVEVARWLVQTGFPATAPAEIDQPVELAHHSVTFWRFYHQHGRPSPGAAELGAILRQLHSLPAPPVQLSRYQPLARLATMLNRTTTLAEQDRTWLLERRGELVSAYHELHSDLGEGLIHADAYPGNLLWNGDQPVLGDWDEVAHGPRELDLINTHHGARFGRGRRERHAFSTAYGWDVTNWDGFAVAREIRDLHTLAVYIERSDADDPAATAELAHRIATLRRAQTDAPWRVR